MSIRLLIDDASYDLEEDSTAIAVLYGGASALLRRVDEAGLDAAIEKAEDWLMPHAARLRDGVLEVSDSTGALKAGMHEALATTTNTWSVEDVESLFLRLVDLATGRVPAAALAGRQAFVAHVLLLRELAHHGRLREVRLL